MGQWELDLGVMELDSYLSAPAHCYLFHLHDSDGGGLTSTVPGTHVAIALWDSASLGQVPVLVVHVVCATVGGVVQMP